MFRTLTAPQLAVDIVVGALFFVLCSLVMFGGGVWGGGASTGWLIVVVLGMSIALTVRRLAPGAALAAAFTCARFAPPASGGRTSAKITMNTPTRLSGIDSHWPMLRPVW
jgi:hypothetical protein